MDTSHSTLTLIGYVNFVQKRKKIASESKVKNPRWDVKSTRLNSSDACIRNQTKTKKKNEFIIEKSNFAQRTEQIESFVWAISYNFRTISLYIYEVRES